MNSRSVALQKGQEVTVEDQRGAMETAQIECLDIEQRNWSRVGTARLVTSDPGQSERLFVKQCLDRSGFLQPDHWLAEQQGAIVARELLHDVADVPDLMFRNQDLLLNVFDYRELTSADILLRESPDAFNDLFAGMLEKLVAVLEVMKKGELTTYADSLPIKDRPYGGPSTAIVFDEFQIRNTGLARTADGQLDPDHLVIFDFVGAYLAPIEEAAAKLFVSVGLLNWGKPLTRFARGADTSLLETALELLEPYLDKRSINAELEEQKASRYKTFLGAGRLEKVAKGLGVATLGRLYLERLTRWCERNIQ